MFDFDKQYDRRGTTSIKWNCLGGFAPHEDMLPYWIADTDFATVPEILEAMKKRLEHPVLGYADPVTLGVVGSILVMTSVCFITIDSARKEKAAQTAPKS